MIGAIGGEVDPNSVPLARRGATAVTNAMTFFARMAPLFVGKEVVATMVAVMSLRWRHAIASSGGLGESGRWEEEEDAVMRRWRCCHAVGGWRTTQ